MRQLVILQKWLKTRRGVELASVLIFVTPPVDEAAGNVHKIGSLQQSWGIVQFFRLFRLLAFASIASDHNSGEGGCFDFRVNDVHEEWISSVLENRPDLSREKLERTRCLMDLHAPDALVTGYEPLIPTLNLPDPNDRHVLAAAIRGGVDVIVTNNIKDCVRQVGNFLWVQVMLSGSLLSPFGADPILSSFSPGSRLGLPSRTRSAGFVSEREERSLTKRRTFILSC